MQLIELTPQVVILIKLVFHVADSLTYPVSEGFLSEL